MKTISVVIPVYNEKENIIDGYQMVKNVFEKCLSSYNYELLFIDNNSNDGSKEILRSLAEKDSNVKVIFNANNFGWPRSSFYGIISTAGDCTVLLAADMQEPPMKIVDFVREWENGYKIVIGIKSRSRENKFLYFIRDCYYRLVARISEVEHINQFMGFGLYDSSFVDVLRELRDPTPYFRGIIAELGFRHKKIEYVQEKRKKGKTHFSFFKMYDLAMLGITSYSKTLIRMATLLGFVVSAGSLIVALVTFILKLCGALDYPVGIAAISIGVFFFGAVQLIFIGFLGEYILSINHRVMNRPLVTVEERLNFSERKD